MKISLSTKKVELALATYKGDMARVQLALKSTNKKGVGFMESTSVVIDTLVVPKDFLSHILESVELTDNQRTTLYNFVSGGALSLDAELRHPRDVQNFFTSMKATADGVNAEMEVLGRWYPVALLARTLQNQWSGGTTCEISGQIGLINAVYGVSFHLTDAFFTDDSGNAITFTGSALMERLHLRPPQTDMAAYNKLVGAANTLAQHTGKVMACTGPVLVAANSMWGGTGWDEIPLGSHDVPKKVVIDADLEANTRQNLIPRESHITRAPFVRAFALDLKAWVQIPMEDIKPYAFDAQAIERLVLPQPTYEMLDKLFHTDVHSLFGDVLQDKHGGMIILANGSSGVGKTLTAEVFAEVTKRPLYIMEMAELGIDVNKIEQNLQVVFNRVTRWNAVLLMDEADVFLAKRGESLERSVIVGIFLRLMDYYKGLLFLTSNRAEVIDPAFKSRITLRLDYPDLSPDARRKIWNIMFETAGMTVKGGLDGIPEIVLNGRQIRNMVRLLRALYGKEVTIDQVKDTCQFTAR